MFTLHPGVTIFQEEIEVTPPKCLFGVNFNTSKYQYINYSNYNIVNTANYVYTTPKIHEYGAYKVDTYSLLMAN